MEDILRISKIAVVENALTQRRHAQPSIGIISDCRLSVGHAKQAANWKKIPHSGRYQASVK